MHDSFNHYFLNTSYANTELVSMSDAEINKTQSLILKNLKNFPFWQFPREPQDFFYLQTTIYFQLIIFNSMAKITSWEVVESARGWCRSLLRYSPGI